MTLQHLFLFSGSFLNSCGCLTAKSKTPPQETIFLPTHLPVQSMGPNHPWPLIPELVSVLEVRIEPGDLNPRPLTLQFVTLPTLPRAFANVLSIFLFHCSIFFFRKVDKTTKTESKQQQLCQQPRKRTLFWCKTFRSMQTLIRRCCRRWANKLRWIMDSFSWVQTSMYQGNCWLKYTR